MAGPPPLNNSLVAAQRTSLQQLELYIANSDWHLRVQIARATGDAELVASRIFKAFEVVRSNSQPRDEVAEVNAAWSELCRNPAITISVIKPILYESVGPEDRDAISRMSLPTVTKENRGVVLSIFVRIARFEFGTNAIAALSDLSASTNTEIAVDAKRSLLVASRENWRAQKTLFDRTRSGGILDWFSDNVLRKGLTRHDVELYLGKGTEGADFAIEYSGTGPRGNTVLRLTFWDDYLIDWRIQKGVSRKGKW